VADVTIQGCVFSDEEIEALERLVPWHLQEGLRHYFEQRVPTGSFLEAVLGNDLVEAIGRADPESMAGMKGLVTWLYNYTPAREPYRVWGDEAAVKSWLASTDPITRKLKQEAT
jgi:hypothetical protein